MLLDDIRDMHKELLKKIVLCDEMEYQSEDLRMLLGALFELSDFLWKFEAVEEYNWESARTDANIFTIKKLCQFIIDEKIDLEYPPMQNSSQLPQRYTEAIDSTKRYLKNEGMLEAVKGEWSLVVYKL
jgi:hypothetical protein